MLCHFILLIISQSFLIIEGNSNTSLSDTKLIQGVNSPRDIIASSVPLFLNESRVFELLEGQWLPLIDAMHQALLAAASKAVVQPPRTFTTIKDRGDLVSMPGYVDLENSDGESEAVLACKLVTRFKQNTRREQPLPSILATILLFDDTTGKLNCILEGTEITARRTAAASIAATNILYNKRHSKTYEDAIIVCILGAGIQGKSHAQAFHAAYKNISEIRIWNHRLPKAEHLVDELKTLGIHQAVVASTAQKCAEGADVLVTATSTNDPILRSEWIKDGAHINAVGSSQTHYSELDLALYQRAKIYLTDEVGGRSELQGLADLGIPLIASVGDIILKPDIMPSEQEVTVFHSTGIAAEDALAAQLVYKRHLRTQLENYMKNPPKSSGTSAAAEDANPSCFYSVHIQPYQPQTTLELRAVISRRGLFL